MEGGVEMILARDNLFRRIVHSSRCTCLVVLLTGPFDSYVLFLYLESFWIVCVVLCSVFGFHNHRGKGFPQNGHISQDVFSHAAFMSLRYRDILLVLQPTNGATYLFVFLETGKFPQREDRLT